jgi:DNA-binding MarR family transcriptional regulator
MTERREHPYTPTRLRELLHRYALDSRRFRETVAHTLGITETESAALAHLSLGDPTTPGDLGRHVALTSGGVTALINRLEQRGYVKRIPHPNDRRSCLLSPTPVAIASVRHYYKPLTTELDRLARALPAEQRTLIGVFLHRASELAAGATEDIQYGSGERDHERVRPPAPDLWA